MKRYIAMIAVIAFAGMPFFAQAQDAKTGATPANKEVTLKGKISKVEVKDDAGKVTKVAYSLTEAGGNKIDLPVKEDSEVAKAIAEAGDANVDVVINGTKKDNVWTVKKVVSVKKSAENAKEPEAKPAEAPEK